jgi:hypothetical protein
VVAAVVASMAVVMAVRIVVVVLIVGGGQKHAHLMSSKPCSLALVVVDGNAIESGCTQLMQHDWLRRKFLDVSRPRKSKKLGVASGC